jgi:NADH-quinone oxidoreductase subunit J
VEFIQLREGFQRYAPVGALVGLMLLVELGVVLAGWQYAPGAAGFRFAPVLPDAENTAQLGGLIYTDYILLFQASGLVLLVAMIGAIVLTLRDRGLSRHQKIDRQVRRAPGETLAMIDVAIGAGVSADAILRPLPEKAPEPAEAHGHGHDHGHGGH